LKTRICLISAAVLLCGIVSFASVQSQEPPQQNQPPVVYGRGQGGIPFAWNDLNRDGVCDLTGQPVGQRPIAFGGGRGRWAQVGQFVGQVAGQAGMLYGRGRGGVPYAWNDRNQDGVCDLTGQPVGQRPIAFGGDRGRGTMVSQFAGQVTGQAGMLYGRGRGGVPYAWNDRNQDGVCDLTGQPVGQRPIAFGGGRGIGNGRGLGSGRGRGGGRWWR